MTTKEYRQLLSDNLPSIRAVIKGSSYISAVKVDFYILFDTCKIACFECLLPLDNEKALDLLVENTLYLGPLSLTTTVNKALRNLNEVYVTTRENYRQYSNPKYYRESLYNNDYFWENDLLVMQTNDCLHFPGAQELLRSQFPGRQVGDLTKHYNSYYYPMNVAAFINMFGKKAKKPDVATLKLFT